MQFSDRDAVRLHFRLLPSSSLPLRSSLTFSFQIEVVKLYGPPSVMSELESSFPTQSKMEHERESESDGERDREGEREKRWGGLISSKERCRGAEGLLV